VCPVRLPLDTTLELNADSRHDLDEFVADTRLLADPNRFGALYSN